MPFYILFFFCLFSHALVFGQDLHYTAIDKSKGLPSNDVYDVFQDKKGFIWLAHEDGLSRYDGYECKTYSSPSQSSRAGTNIQEDKFGRIWYQNFDGMLYYLQGDSMQALQQNPPVGYMEFGVSDKSLYVIQKKGIDVFDLKDLKLLQTIPFNVAEISFSYFINNKYYIIKKDSLHELNSQHQWRKYPSPAECLNDVPSLIEASAKSIVLVSKFNHSQKCYELGEKTYAPKFQLPNINFIQNIAYSGGYYWICTPEGVYVYDEKGKPLHLNSPFLVGKSTTSVLKDREGNFWFGTRGAGVLFVGNLDSKIVYDHIKPFRILRQNNTLYIGTQNDELYRADLNDYSIQQIYKGKDNHPVNILYYDSLSKQLMVCAKNFMLMSESGKIENEWIAATKAAVRINEKYHAFAISGAFGLSNFNSEKSENEWDKLYKKYYGKTNPFIQSQFVAGTRGKSIAYNEGLKTIYFASSNGLWKATLDTIYEIKHADTSIYIQKMCLVGQDLYGYNTTGALLKINPADKLELVRLDNPLKRVKNLKKQGHFLLVLTEDELLFMDSRQANPTLKKTNLHHADINDFVLWNDQLVLANKNGILIQHFEQETPKNAPLFHINSIKVNGMLQNDQKQLQFAYYQNNIEIQYSILSFKTAGQFALYYQINNNPWELAPAETRLLKLVALSPGLYDIRFQLGTPNNTRFPIQTIHLQIAFPWWQQWWFWGLSFLLIGTASYAYYRQQTNMLIQQNKLLSEKIELEQDLSQSTLKAIKAQMNPHFFYNALNTVQSFIYADDKKNASAYLSKFSKLTRMILEMSEKEKIPLSEELDALFLYLDIEKVRFNDDFEYAITLASEVDKEMIKIPSMLIQPYIENAIKHGLLHKKGHKTLAIHFELDTDFLKVTIHDNGIGRKQSEELNKIKKDKHQSFSSNANATRLELLTRGKSIKPSVVYIDHTDPTATTVILTIPLK